MLDSQSIFLSGLDRFLQRWVEVDLLLVIRSAKVRKNVLTDNTPLNE